MSYKIICACRLMLVASVDSGVVIVCSNRELVTRRNFFRFDANGCEMRFSYCSPCW